MPRFVWPLHNGRPKVEMVLTLALGGTRMTRILLADTGAGSEQSSFELILDEDDCLLCNGFPTSHIQLGGAFSGLYPVYGVRVEIPQIGFDDDIDVVGVPQTPTGADGIACFRFLNRFAYGNFGNRTEFGIEL